MPWVATASNETRMCSGEDWSTARNPFHNAPNRLRRQGTCGAAKTFANYGRAYYARFFRVPKAKPLAVTRGLQCSEVEAYFTPSNLIWKSMIFFSSS